jgi:glycosyltransferase involved in cell wall biosynthesis
MIKVICISYSFSQGGAAKAANNFSSILKTDPSIVPVLLPQRTDDKIQYTKRLISLALGKLQFDGNPIKHSLNLFSFSSVLKSFKKNKHCLHHFHWINNDTLSVFDFSKIPLNSIITLHDEWLYCGSEHYYNLTDANFDFINGYKPLKKGVLGINWNYLIWKIKFLKLQGRKDLIFTVPSTWMETRARSSSILRNSEIHLLPNPIDTINFSPSSLQEINTFRKSFNLNSDDIIIAFGAIGGDKNRLKGASILKEAFELLHEEFNSEDNNKIKFMTFGGINNRFTLKCGYEVISLGHISNPKQLALIYSSSDFVVVPSLVESFGQVAAEALACETPVVCFDSSGLRDIVLNNENGYLIGEFNAKALAIELLKIIKLSHEERKNLGMNGRQHVLKNFSFPVISEKYLGLLKDVHLRKFRSN